MSLLKHRWIRRLGALLALVALERTLAALLASAEGAQVLMAAGPGTPIWVLLAFVLLLGLRLSLFFLAPGWLLGWLAGEVVEGRWG
ncbi:MAG: hypothetical protein H6741_06425 [Alphaproteobacteria bacterium]|nr:hypothetical protein [Alphaproteobacteria bacterium]MCB9792346.1 hypothetical protein [Alphaproteobacteria bacterium]